MATFDYTITADTTLVANFDKDPVDPLESVASPVVASAVIEGDNLSQSNLSGAFEDPETGVAVAGALGWQDGSQQVNLTGNYTWVFTPDDQNLYNQITGMVEVEAQDVTKPQVQSAFSGDNEFRVTIRFTEDVTQRIYILLCLLDNDCV